METYDIIASMESKKDLTKELIANCFHELMLTTPFDKITIKMITGEAGLIRPTFYKHFQDKYEVLEWLFKTNVMDNVDLLLNNEMESDAQGPEVLPACLHDGARTQFI